VPADIGVDLARARLGLMDTVRAETTLHEVLKVEPRAVRGWLLEAELARARRDAVAEAEALTRAVGLDPSLTEARERLAQIDRRS
jgi:hypothetical protein